MPDWGTVLPNADVAAGKTISAKCEQCHDLSKGGPNKIGPNLYGVVDRPRASHPGFDYSGAMKAKNDPWTYDELFKYLKSPQRYVPGTKMTFAGLPRAQDRINLIAYPAQQCRQPGADPGARAQDGCACCWRRSGCGWCSPGCRSCGGFCCRASQCRQRGRTLQHRDHNQGRDAGTRGGQRPIGTRRACHAEKVRAQAGKTESPLHAAAGLGRPGQKRVERTRI